MASSEKFCLRWNDFESNISVAFRDLREEKDFFDITLACDDSSQVQAHKVILSACSPWFRNVLRQNPHQHPLLYLKGVKYKELVSVLNFMYQGEVNVAQEELNSFLAVAEDLRVKGLTQNNSSSDSKSKSDPAPVKASRPAPPVSDPPPKRPRPAPVQSYQQQQPQDDDEIQEVMPVKAEPGTAVGAAAVEPQHHYQPDPQPAGTVALDEAYADESYDYGQYGEGGYDDGSGGFDPNTGMPLAGADGNKDLAAMLGRVTRDEAGAWLCPVCSLAARSSTNIREHIQSKHCSGHTTYICPLCGKLCKTAAALRIHKVRYHKDEILPVC